MEPIKVNRKNNLRKETGSLNRKIPVRTVPTAPIPVHTAYAVPMGSVCVAFTNKIILILSVTRNPAYHKYISIPALSLALPRQEANPTSNKPAIIKIIQFIFLCNISIYPNHSLSSLRRCPEQRAGISAVIRSPG